MKHRLLALLLPGLLGAAAPVAKDLLQWPDCPPAEGYSFLPDPRPAHYQTTPVAGPSGGTCALDVVTGSVFTPANSAGGVAFGTSGEVVGATYTLAFDFQRVKGDDPWAFENEQGNGVVNGLSFQIPASKDRCWHRYEFTAPLGPAGSMGTLFIYQGKTQQNVAPVLEEMRIDNMTLSVARRNAPLGLVEVSLPNHPGDDCCDRCDGNDQGPDWMRWSREWAPLECDWARWACGWDRGSLPDGLRK